MTTVVAMTVCVDTRATQTLTKHSQATLTTTHSWSPILRPILLLDVARTATSEQEYIVTTVHKIL